MENSDYILQMKNITKEFPGVKALSEVGFDVLRGEVHALIGENGAGKSTLIKIISGVYPYGSYKGQILIDGKEAKFNTIQEVEKAGIACIHQELNIVPEMSVAENIFLNEKPTRFGMIDFDELYKQTLDALQLVGMNKANGPQISPDEKVKNLGTGQRQMVEIAKALQKNAKLLILDEPTASLTDVEVETLLGLLKDLREQGVTSIYISHKLDEVIEIADRITVLRDGQTINTCATSATNMDEMIRMMVGRELNNIYPREPHQRGEVGFELRNYSVPHPDIPGKKLLNNINLKAYKGEILGICGLMGAGRTELFTAAYGAFREKGEGQIFINDKEVKISSPMDALSEGFVIISEDRKKLGLNLLMDIKQNITLASLKKFSKAGFVDNDNEVKTAKSYMDSMRIVAPNIDTQVRTLSGGNQQKVVIAKAMAVEPKVIVLDEPTRGIDVGAKYEIYKLMNQLVDAGATIIMISSEMEEIIGMSDRVLTIASGQITGEFDEKDLSQEKLMQATVPVG